MLFVVFGYTTVDGAECDNALQAKDLLFLPLHNKLNTFAIHSNSSAIHIYDSNRINKIKIVELLNHYILPDATSHLSVLPCIDICVI